MCRHTSGTLLEHPRHTFDDNDDNDNDDGGNGDNGSHDGHGSGGNHDNHGSRDSHDDHGNHEHLWHTPGALLEPALLEPLASASGKMGTWTAPAVDRKAAASPGASTTSPSRDYCKSATGPRRSRVEDGWPQDGPKVFQRVFQSVPESVPDPGTILGTPPSINDYHSKRGVPGWNTSFFNKRY